MKYQKFLTVVSTLAFLASLASSQAQTTLSGDHIITGDLSVGTSGTKAGISVMGETGNSAAPGLQITGDGGVVFSGNAGTGQIPLINSTAFAWVPKKAAFVVGEFAVELENNQIGTYSVRMGVETFATGYAAMVMGGYSSASGDFSFAMGQEAHASGDMSVAIGDWVATSGHASTALGVATTADSYASVAIGKYNVGGGDPDGWDAADAVFEIGIGTGEEAKRNALTVYKNGNVVIPKRQGDILMGEFGNPE